jgi:hypothetical protein
MGIIGRPQALQVRIEVHADARALAGAIDFAIRRDIFGNAGKSPAGNGYVRGVDPAAVHRPRDAVTCLACAVINPRQWKLNSFRLAVSGDD